MNTDRSLWFIAKVCLIVLENSVSGYFSRSKNQLKKKILNCLCFMSQTKNCSLKPSEQIIVPNFVRVCFWVSNTNTLNSSSPIFHLSVFQYLTEICGGSTNVANRWHSWIGILGKEIRLVGWFGGKRWWKSSIENTNNTFWILNFSPNHESLDMNLLGWIIVKLCLQNYVYRAWLKQ